MAADEEDIRCKDNAVCRNVDQRVAASVRRAYFDEMHLLIAHVEHHFACEGLFRRNQSGIFKIERREGSFEEFTDLTHCRGLFHEKGKLLWRQFKHLLCRALRGDDLRIGDELVAIAMIAIGMGVHHHIDV
jgi:hypothetical protein